MTNLEASAWVIFLAGALLFLATAIRSGDDLAIWGSGLFVIGIVMFLVPAARKPFGR